MGMFMILPGSWVLKLNKKKLAKANNRNAQNSYLDFKVILSKSHVWIVESLRQLHGLVLVSPDDEDLAKSKNRLLPRVSEQKRSFFKTSTRVAKQSKKLSSFNSNIASF